MKFNPLIPELYVSDFQKSIDFYVETLEFKLAYQREAPKFAFLTYLGSQLMIQQEDDNEAWHNGIPAYPFGRGINFQIETNDVQHLVDKLTKINYPLKRGLEDSNYKVKDAFYRCREFLVMDPDGYLLRFSQPL